MSDTPAHSGLVFGFDLGPKSCGMAVLDMGGRRVVHMASQIFKAPEVDKTGQSKAAERRAYRSARTNRKRSRDRRKHAMRLFQGVGLVPADADPRWFETGKGEGPVLALRGKALGERLTDRELARVLFYLCSHRQYIDQSSSCADDPDKGKVLKALSENVDAMREGGYETVGTMLLARQSQGLPVRNSSGVYDLCVPHELIREEASKIVRAQLALGNGKVAGDFEEELLSVMSWMYPTYERDLGSYSLVGCCSSVPGERRAAMATLAYERETLLEALVNARIVDEVGGRRPIPGEIRSRIASEVFDPSCKFKKSEKGLTYKRLRQMIGASMGAHDTFLRVPEDKEASTLLAKLPAYRALKAALAPDLMGRLLDDPDLYDDIAEALTFASSTSSLERRLDDLGIAARITGTERAEIMALPVGSPVFKGYGSRSRTALLMLADALDDPDIESVAAAEEACGIRAARASKRGRASLLPPYSKYDPTCRNPVVLRSAARFRKMYNAAVRAFGKPVTVRIELTRDLKNTRAAKARIERGQRDARKANEICRKKVAETLGISEDAVQGRQLLMMRLYEDQHGRDAYTGEPMELRRVLTERKYSEIDHILPYSRSLDDSRANKVLCLGASNQLKGARTPYEWMTSGESGAPDFDAFAARVEADVAYGARKWRLLKRDFAEEGKTFLSRNLNDTAYMSRQFAAWVRDTIAFEDDGRQHVFAVAGSATGLLRRIWGLNFGADGNKDRSDDRHHAVDACVIAACTPSLVQRCARYSESRGYRSQDEREALLRDSMPWPEFADEVRAIRGFVVPVVRNKQSGTGRATEDTLYRIEGRNPQGKLLVSVKKGDERQQKVMGNPVLLRDGEGDYVRSNGNLAFLRLWRDDEARPNGKVKGCWYAEPVYYSDLPAINDGTYVSRYCKCGKPIRSEWPLIPSRVMNQIPISLRQGSRFFVNGKLYTFNRIDIDSCKLEAIPMGHEVKIPSLGSWGRDTLISLVNEDSIGLCYMLRSRA